MYPNLNRIASKLGDCKLNPKIKILLLPIMAGLWLFCSNYMVLPVVSINNTSTETLQILSSPQSSAIPVQVEKIEVLPVSLSAEEHHRQIQQSAFGEFANLLNKLQSSLYIFVSAKLFLGLPTEKISFPFSVFW